MRKIAFDSVLLIALITPFIMGYRLSPNETPYWLFGFIFLGMFLYIFLDILPLQEKKYFILKHLMLWVMIVIVIGSAFSAAIIVRHKTHPIYMIHDIIIQQEAAIRYLLDGKNPYATTYFDTPLEEWHYSDTNVNPALYHFVMEPFYLVFALPFYVVSNLLFGFFDGRIPLLFLFLGLLATADILVKEKRDKFIFLILLAFNPAMLAYTLEGRSDIFMYAFMFFGFFLLHNKRYILSGVPMGLAFAIKQSAWPVLPFYLAFIYFKTKNAVITGRTIVVLLLVFFAIILPFAAWNTEAFINSTIFYVSGNTPHSYPVSGYGLGKLLQELGFIKDLQAYYPFHIWQTVIGLPLLLVLIGFLKKAPSVSRLILVYGIFLFVFWYFSRYFNNSHLGYLSMVFITAYFWPVDESSL